MEKKQFLNKDITIKKVDNSFVRGFCISENDLGLTVNVKSSDKIVFVPYNQISEVLTSSDDNERKDKKDL